MEYDCIIGESDLKDFTPWWEEHLPSWLILYCRSGEAQLSLLLKGHSFRCGMAAIIAPDMYPVFSNMSENFRVYYCLMSRDFVSQHLNNELLGANDSFYIKSVLDMSGGAEKWMELLNDIYNDTGNAYRLQIIADLLHGFVLDYTDRWNHAYGNLDTTVEKSSAETLCERFYNLVFDHYRESRSIAFYADKLCITPSYLAMITRQICDETPKDAIDRQVTLDIKHMLLNTPMKNKQIADYLNFPDTSYMCRYFRRQTGMSPSEYRKSAIGQDGAKS